MPVDGGSANARLMPSQCGQCCPGTLHGWHNFTNVIVEVVCLIIYVSLLPFFGNFPPKNCMNLYFAEQVRAAVPMYLLSRKIKAGGFKVVLSGEGADEIYGGYLYFHKAPSPQEFQQCAAPFLPIRALPQRCALAQQGGSLAEGQELRRSVALFGLLCSAAHSAVLFQLCCSGGMHACSASVLAMAGLVPILF